MRNAAVIAAVLALSLSFTVQANEEKLDYDHQEKWQSALDRAQSPIDIVTVQTVKAEDNEPLGLQLWQTEAPIEKAEDNGHAVQVNTDATEAMIRGRHFKLAQFHFHAESEHTIDAKHYPLEGHFVFKAQDGRLAVIGVMYQIGEHVAELDARRATRRPEQDDDGDLVGLGDDVGFEVRLGHLDGVATGGRAVGRADAARVRVHRQGEPLPDARATAPGPG